MRNKPIVENIAIYKKLSSQIEKKRVIIVVFFLPRFPYNLSVVGGSLLRFLLVVHR